MVNIKLLSVATTPSTYHKYGVYSVGEEVVGVFMN